MKPLSVVVVGLLALAAVASQGGLAQQPGVWTTTSGEWPSYAGDLKNQHYSPLNQVTAANFDQLEVA